MDRIKQILVVGGGTAGWLAACHLAKKWQGKGVSITLLESPNIPTIGVGEGTVPMMRETLRYFGIAEDEFIRRCDVTFKQSVKFIDWNNEDASGDYYHHLFDFPHWREFTQTWLNSESRPSYANTVSIQGWLADLGLAPKTITHPQFQGLTSYAYHLDAAKFTALLTEHGKQLGVEHLLADVCDVNYSPGSGIESVRTLCGQEHAADLFVDCTGFSARLIGDACGVPFIDKNDVLLVDTAIVLQQAYRSDSQPIACFTQSTAKEAGWIWDIGLSKRRGVGYVYSSRHTTDSAAEQVLAEYLGQDGIAARKIDMKVGYRAQSWHGNCVAIGLASGFVEPLEATGLLMFDVTSRMLAETLPVHKDAMPLVAARFNQQVEQTWLKVIDFIKLHYVLSNRRDTDFWRDNQRSETITESLKQSLALWQYQAPTPYDFHSSTDIFKLENYLYVLYGMNYKTMPTANTPGDLALMEREAKRFAQKLPSHRQVLEQIKLHGLQRV